MKNKKRSTLISLLVSIALIITNNYAFANSDSKPEIDNKLNIMIRKTYKVDWNMLENGMTKEQYLEKFRNEVPSWTYNEREDVMEEYVTFENCNIEIENLNSRNKKSSENVALVTVKNEDNIEIASQKINLNNDSNTVIIDIAADEIMQVNNDVLSIQNSRASSNNPYWSIGEAGAYGKAVHCNRFNGYLGNNKYYNTSHPQSLINFIGSDCDYAVLKNPSLCINDYSSNNSKRYCSASPTSKNGKCSTYIGHYNKFHFHK